MLFLVCLKLQPILFDVGLNGVDVVVGNAFEANFVLALRFHSIVDSLFLQQNVPMRKGSIMFAFAFISVSSCETTEAVVNLVACELGCN